MLGLARLRNAADSAMGEPLLYRAAGVHRAFQSCVMSLKGILAPAEQELLREERRIMTDLRGSLIRFGASDENMAPLERSIEQLDELFLLVVVGEFNAGKSAFINALAGQRLMEEGVTPTTAQVTPVRYEDINIVDTPANNARRLLGVTPEIFPVSAKLAFRAKTGEPQHWAASGFDRLESYIRKTLDSASRTKLKLLNPLGVGSALIDRYAVATKERLGELTQDFALLGDVERQLDAYERDMRRDFEGRMATVDNVLLEMERRGHEYFDDTMRIGRMLDL